MRDWRRLPYWGTTVAVESTIGDIYKLLAKVGVRAYRVTQQPEPEWKLLVEWEQTVGENVIVVAFEIVVADEELQEFTDRQAAAVRAQAARLVFHTIKNLVAAHEAGLITLNEIFLARMQTYGPDGQPASVGDLVLRQMETAGQIGPTIIRKALPGGQG